MHRDVKIENFLVGNSINDIKLIDFGVSTFYDEKNPPEFNNFGTIVTLSPELYLTQKYTGLKIDCWALGICLFELLTNKFPFDPMNPKMFVN